MSDVSSMGIPARNESSDSNLLLERIRVKRSGIADALSLPRLLVLASTYPRWAGDSEPVFVHALSSRLTRALEVHVLCPHAPGAQLEEVLDGVHIHRFRYAPNSLETLVQGGGILGNLKHAPWKGLLLPLFFIGLGLSTWRLAKKLHPSCIHAHWIIPQGLVVAVLSMFQRMPPMLLTSHGGDLFGLRGRLFARLKRAVVQRADTVTVVSQAMVDEVVRLGVDPKRIQVVPMGVDFDGLFTPDPTEARQPGEILFVGRLVEKKGLRYLIEALPAIIAKVPETRLRIVGGGPEEGALRELAHHLGVNLHIEFLGAQPQVELPALYRRASIFVAPFIEANNGDREGLGLVTVEAIACGCPVVVGDLPALDEILEPTEADLRVDPKQTTRLAQAVLTILAQPEASRMRVLSIRARLAKKLDWTSTTAAYVRLLCPPHIDSHS